MYKHDPESSMKGGLASGVPGDVKGLEYLHSKYGVWYHMIEKPKTCTDTV